MFEMQALHIHELMYQRVLEFLEQVCKAAEGAVPDRDAQVTLLGSEGSEVGAQMEKN